LHQRTHQAKCRAVNANNKYSHGKKARRETGDWRPEKALVSNLQSLISSL
jgi:hypothetical protein